MKINTTRTLLVIGAGPAQVAGISIAKKRGCRVIAIDENPRATGLEIADIGIVKDVKDCDGAIALAKKHHVNGVFSVASEVSLPTIAAVNEALGLPGLSRRQVALVTNKGAMRQLYAKHGIPSTPFFIVAEETQLFAACDLVGFPAVIKPVDSAGSRGVRFAKTFDQVQALYGEVKKYSRLGHVIIEKFMPGTEVSVEAFVVRGEIHILTLSDKNRTDPPYLLDTAVMFPSRQAPELQEQIRDVAISAIRSLGLDNCPVHMEQIVTTDGPKVVEVAARGPGFKVYTDIIPHVTGVNVVEAQVCLLLGETPKLLLRKPLKGACIRFWGGKSGKVKDVSGVKAARVISGVLDLEIYIKSGDTVKNLTCGDDRIGHIITLADTREGACAIADQAFATVKIELE